MILQALVAYYEALAAQGRAERPGWTVTKIAYALEIGADGTLMRIAPLATIAEGEKKPRPRPLSLPVPIKRSSGIAPNFLWDTSAYLLGLDDKGNPARARSCFDASKALHQELLGASDDPFARAIVQFFERWNPDTAADNPLIQGCPDDLIKTANITFLFDTHYPAENPALRAIWQAHYDGEADRAAMRCLITGDLAVPALIHPAIKGVQGAQSSGAALCSYNAPAFCSFDREQNLNAPVSKYAAFAYTTALNLLISDRGCYRRFGDTTVVFWAEGAKKEYQDAMAGLLDDDDDTMTQDDLRGFVEALAGNKPAAWENAPLSPDQPFYLLGVSPNAARLSVRFFLRSTFGKLAENLLRFYQDTFIASDNRSTGWMPLWRLLKETVNPNANDKTPSPQMSGDTLRAILTGGMYPATLYQQVQLRIRADHALPRERAAIIKAYLTRIPNNEPYREGLKVDLNDQTTYQPYVLGRLFAVLESIQRAANPGINATIRDKYFTSACATPALVFPTLVNLAQKHLRKIGGGLSVHYAIQLTELTSRITESYPAHHSLYEQGVFQLGYYHQVQKIFTAKEKTDDMKEAQENG